MAITHQRSLAGAVRGVRGALRRGMTLIELMVVIGIVVILMAAGTIGIASIRGADVSATASILTGALRYVYTLAIHHNKTYRLVIDMDNRRFYTEAADDESDPCARYIPEEGTDEPGQGRGDEDAPRDEDEEEGAAPGGRFSEDASELLSEDFRPDTNVTAVFTEHHREPQTSGRAAIYFYPTGRAERAMIWVGEGEEEDGQMVWLPDQTLEVFTLGRVVRYPHAVDEREFMRDLK